ncbi:MAG TPA: hypothetical protein VFT58_04500, partial [Nitrososphaera sp.]|nr:hypothetical protein [Nitrososphaera sp.]
MVALAELLRARGEDAVAASSSRLNGSIPPSLRALDVQFQTKLESSEGNVFTFVDLSDPEHFDFDAKVEDVAGVIDHHPGFEKFWKDKLGDAARLEFV